MPRRASPFSVMILAAAIFLRLWVPAGWMPDAHGGPFAIAPCPAAEPAAAMPMMHDHHDGQSGHHNDAASECSFGSLQASVAAPASAAPLQLPALAPFRAQRPAADLPFSTGPPAPPPPATGPPAFA